MLQKKLKVSIKKIKTYIKVHRKSLCLEVSFDAEADRKESKSEADITLMSREQILLETTVSMELTPSMFTQKELNSPVKVDSHPENFRGEPGKLPWG